MGESCYLQHCPCGSGTPSGVSNTAHLAKRGGFGAFVGCGNSPRIPRALSEPLLCMGQTLGDTYPVTADREMEANSVQ